ncbi:DUF1481 domain-containing protein [Vibrio cholerae]|nr:DUF1481 domain-containing protein [Vibrio cholerae]
MEHLGVFVYEAAVILPLFALWLIGGCSSTPNPNLEQINQFTGGKTIGDATSFYWYTESFQKPSSASDYVTSGDYGSYQTSYRWEEGQVREIRREGEHLDGKKLVPFRVHIRFSKEGEAVYQQYRLGGKVLPMNEEQLAHYVLQAKAVAEATKEQDKQGLELIQGYWNGKTFETCQGVEYQRVEFNQSLPSFVFNRLASIESYVAFLGKIRNGKVHIDELLLLDDAGHDCVKEPELLD